jgi:hypothetical protein
LYPKSFEPDLARGEADLGRSHQARRIVDDPHDSQRCSLLPTALPDSERLEGGDRSGEQRCRTVVERSMPPDDERRLDGGRGERNCRSEACRPAADDDNFARIGLHQLCRSNAPPGRHRTM